MPWAAVVRSVMRFVPSSLAASLHRMFGAKPWSSTYHAYRSREIARLLSTDHPKVPRAPFGAWIDERVVEYTWALQQLGACEGGRQLLDAGAGMNVPMPLRVMHAQGWSVASITLQREAFENPRVRYFEGDLRKLPFDDGRFDAVCCVSTLEHVGMDNARYAKGESAQRSNAGDWRAALLEMWRVTAPGGTLLVTAPCGRATEHGWFQVFPIDFGQRVQAQFPDAVIETSHFLHRQDGWRKVEPACLADCECWDPAAMGGRSPPRAAFSEGVVCVAVRKPPVGPVR